MKSISARALPVTQTVMGLPGAGFLRGRRTRGSFTAASAATRGLPFLAA
jgi:hypothetical protein